MTVEETRALLSEAVLLTRIEHPNIIRIYSAGTVPTCAGVTGFFTMEYVSGGTLDRFWQSHGTKFVPIETSLDIIVQVSDAIARAHAERPPVIHRDIKPQNILIGYDAQGLRAKVSDFGLAKRVDPVRLFASGRGTLAFKPPEVVEDLNRDSTAGDVWAIGSVLYLLLTDRLPFSSLDEDDSFHHSRFRRPLIPPSRLNITVDPSLDQIVARALAIRLEDRYLSSGELLEDLKRWQRRPPGGRPKSTGAEMSEGSSGSPKSVLGERSPLSVRQPSELAKEALTLADKADGLVEAADLMEQALNMDPALREKHESQLRRWRKRLAKQNADSLRTAREMAEQALAVGRQSTNLEIAIRLMEQALQLAPDLKNENDYHYYLKLWRRGINQ